MKPCPEVNRCSKLSGALYEAYPDKELLFTEGCVERFDAGRFQDWTNAEHYGTSMINDFNNGTVGWIDWNILLDEKGGPNHAGNLCFAPVHANTATGELIYTPSYYYIGHFSKFIRPNAKPSATSPAAARSPAPRSGTTTLPRHRRHALIRHAGKIPVIVGTKSGEAQHPGEGDADRGLLKPFCDSTKRQAEDGVA